MAAHTHPGLAIAADRGACRSDLRLDDDDYRTRLHLLQDRLRRLQVALYHNRKRAIVVFEGWDASGKGGIIKRMLNILDPRGFRVWPIGAPQAHELRYPYLHRFWQRLPQPGELVVFDRSWYGRVLIEHVEGLVDPATYERAFDEINQFETLLINDGIILVKCWLEVSPQVQIKRFKRRFDDPLKRWKLTEEDFIAYAKRSAYEPAVDRMVSDCSVVPWAVIPCHQKMYGRIAALTYILDQLEPLVPEFLPSASDDVRAFARTYFDADRSE